MTYRQLFFRFLLFLIFLIAFVYALPVHADRLTPEEIEWTILSEDGGMNFPGHDCKNRALDAIHLARENGYKASLRWSRTHWWVVIYDNKGQKHEILQDKSMKRWMMKQVGV